MLIGYSAYRWPVKVFCLPLATIFCPSEKDQNLPFHFIIHFTLTKSRLEWTTKGLYWSPVCAKISDKQVRGGLHFKGVTVDFKGHLYTVFGCFLMVSYHKKTKKVKNRKTGIFKNCRFLYRTWKLIAFSESTLSETLENTIQTF